ncbi:signal peptide protein [Tropilaelaps mercedesae]|uniref:Signal peptide protein n=1 Tax=Tropilaelaps mercedesae TaxID=418985 RepID=A0A1V9XSG3_9ACAR|nr:signal peptide protein [Tropilaelaps mercedesae]
MASFTRSIGALLLLAIILPSVAAYSNSPTWINCTRNRCHCEKSADCYENEPGVCMRLLLGGTNCRYCPHGYGVLYHLPEDPLPEGLPYTKVCHPMKICEDTRCFDTAQCQELHSSIGIGMRTRQQNRCICERGYKAERLAPGVERCVDIDECSLANRSMPPRGLPGFTNLPPSSSSPAHEYCPPKSRCVNTVGAFECRCVEGYRERYDNGLKCEDVDECEHLGFGACPWYLACINEAGSYRCANPFYRWVSNELFLLIIAIILLFVVNILICWICRATRRCLGYEDRFPVRQRHKQLDKYTVARL